MSDDRNNFVPAPDNHDTPFYAARQALRRHANGGNILIGATLLALIVANIPSINSYYFNFWNEPVRLQIGDFNVFSHSGHPMTELQFINEALSAVCSVLWPSF